MNTALLIVLLVNAIRQTPVVISEDLSEKAQVRAEYFCNHKLSHDGFEKQFTEYVGGGENLSRGYSPVQANVAWLQSPSHHANMLEPRWKYTGVGQACDVIVQLFSTELK